MSSALVDQAGCRTNLTGRTVAALKSIMVDKGLLYRMQPAVLSQTLDRRYLRTVVHDRERQAGIDPAPVRQNRTRAALAVVATLLRPGEAEMNSQRVEESGPGSDGQFVGNAIDMKRDRRFRRRRQIFADFASR